MKINWYDDIMVTTVSEDNGEPVIEYARVLHC
jgi:hypothetical protein